MIPYEHIPIWLRLTNRRLIDPQYKSNIERSKPPEVHRKLSPAIIAEIRRSTGRVSEIAQRFGVSEMTVYRARKGLPQYRKLTPTIRRQIVQAHGTGPEVAARFGVSTSTVYRLRSEA